MLSFEEFIVKIKDSDILICKTVQKRKNFYVRKFLIFIDCIL